MAVELDVGHPLLLPPGGGEVVGGSQEDRRVELLSDGDQLHTTWTRFRPDRLGAELHVHRGHTDLFYVLGGELTLMLGADGDEIVVGPGTLVLAPPLVVHGFRNASDTELCYLNFHAPGGGFAAFMRGLTPGFDSEGPPADGGRPVEDAVIADGGGLLVDTDAIRIEEVQRDSGSNASTGDEERPTESFYVLAGELVFSIDDNESRAGIGAWVQLPAGIAYTLTGAGRYLAIRAPGRPT